MRSDWAALPERVGMAVADRVGGIVGVYPAPCGDHAEIASTVIGSTGTVFVKAASSGPGVRSLRYELAVTKAIDRYPPAVFWDFESDGWLVVGAEHLDGSHPDLSPGSPDLDTLAETLEGLQETAAPDMRLFGPAGRLSFAHPAMDGDALVHSDLNPANLILTPQGLRIVDWAYATKAAPWVELALLTQWLIGNGHTPAQAEDWLSQFPTWSGTDPEVLDDFAARNAAKWANKSRQSTESWVHDLALWTYEWAAYRA
ncbi:phosphotransferase [Micromonospora sp. S-DT3-3-22]|uniref:phosphotransferase n=1 Tax=Micromonospora sp. S-DT3-3-22 TaxID=2755359 RepID=UPI00188E4687|nr:phosphotransferase [Micromonospora sp. S-DT3-3-22]